MKQQKKELIRIDSISIKNYKGIDQLDIEFPKPFMPDDPDVCVIGSENGLGKTSVLECCALLMLGLTPVHPASPISDELPSLMVRSGNDMTEISGELRGAHLDSDGASGSLKVTKEGVVYWRIGAMSSIDYELPVPAKDHTEHFRQILGYSANAVLEKYFLLVHSFRKIREGSVELSTMVNGGKGKSQSHVKETDVFKTMVLNSMMAKAGLFEGSEENIPEDAVEKLNVLMREYAGGTIQKIRPNRDNSVDIRVTPENGNDSFPLDGLSSGQKEIITTLFMIWYHTLNNPMVVLIDEPELHLNAQWHRSFIKKLVEIAPHNQYIIATHSEEVMASVEKERRILLVRE